MTHLMRRRELLAAGIGVFATLRTGGTLAQSSQTAPREPGTDALGRRIGGPPRGRGNKSCGGKPKPPNCF